ncbi:MAG: LPS assembly lipoprotein LptE [Desulfobacterales bacterium]
MFLMTKPIKGIRLLFCFFAFVFIACGYKFAGSGSFPGGVRSIYITIFENRTLKTGIEKIFTDDLINEFIRKNEAVLAAHLENAEAILSGVITGMGIETVFHTGADTSDEREVTIGVSFKLKDRHKKVLWANVVLESQTYPVGLTKTETEQNLQDAIIALSERIAEKAFNRLTSDF